MEAVGESSVDSSGYGRLGAQAMRQTAMEVEATEFSGARATNSGKPECPTR